MTPPTWSQNPVAQSERRLRFLDQLAQATRSMVDAAGILKATARMLGEHLQCNRCAYAQVEPDQDHFDLIGDFNHDVPSMVGRYAFSDFGGEVLRLMRSDLPYVNPDVDRHPATAGSDLTAYRLTQIQAVICVPLHKNGRFVAAMAVHQKTARAWSPDEIELVREVVSRCWESLDRIRSAQALREAHQRLSLALSSGELGDWSWDARTNQVMLSERAAEIFATDGATTLTLDQLCGLLHPQDRGLARSGFDAVAAGNDHFTGEYRVTVDDKPRWISAQGKATRLTDGPSTGLIGIVQDVTGRRDAETRLRESEAKFRTFAQTMPNQVWTATPDGMLDWLNDQTAAYSAMTLEALRGTGWTRIVHPDDLQSAGTLWSHSLATGEPYETEFRLQRSDGSYRWHLARATALQGDAGQVTLWVGTNTDIEDQRQARDSLAQLNSALAQRVEQRTHERNRVWDVSQDLLVVLGQDGVFRDVNPAFTRLLGYAPADVIGKSFHEFVLPQDHQASQEALAHARHEVLNRFENRYRHKDGGQRWFSWTVSPDDTGTIYANGRDITDEKQARAQLAAAESALRQSQKMEAVGKLTSGIAHDFNNLLHGMVTAMSLVKRQLGRGQTETSEKYVDMALGSAQRATALTHRLLAFSRQQPLDPRPVQVNTLVASLEELFGRTIGPSITLVFEPGQTLWATRCDHHQLENALLNLVVNARDAMPDGGRLTISTCNRSITAPEAAATRQFRAGDFVRIRVTDTGVGMAPAVLEQVFEPFFTTKPIGQGTGLGLSMIYGFAEQSGGFMGVQSEPGAGAMFDIYLPRYLGEAVSARPVDAPAAPVARVGRGRTIQLIEDDTVVRTLTAEALSAAGYTVVQASDGRSGLDSLMMRPQVDLLVTDVGLPGLNGRQVADAARRKYPTLPVLFVTGYADQGDVSADRLPDGMKVVSKPIDMNTLLLQVGRMLD